MSWAPCFRPLLTAGVLAHRNTAGWTAQVQISGGHQPRQWPMVSPAQSPTHDPAPKCIPHSKPRGSWSHGPSPHLSPRASSPRGLFQLPHAPSHSPVLSRWPHFLYPEKIQVSRQELPRSLTPNAQTSWCSQGPPPFSPPEDEDCVPSCSLEP